MPPDKRERRPLGEGAAHQVADHDTAIVPQAASEPDLRDPAVWAIWSAGYLAGVRHGIPVGYAEAGQDWTNVTTLGCRTGVAAVRPGSRYDRAPQTAAQIRASADYSWRRFERDHDERRAG